MEGLEDGDEITVTLTREPGKDVGTYAISAAIDAGNNYDAAFEGSQLTIQKRTLIVTADPKYKKCGRNDPELTYRVDGLVDGDEITVTLTREEGWDVGKYQINGEVQASDNYNVVYKGATFTIAEAVCELCGKVHDGAFPDNLIGVIHGLIWIMRCFLLLPVTAID